MRCIAAAADQLRCHGIEINFVLFLTVPLHASPGQAISFARSLTPSSEYTIRRCMDGFSV